MLCQNIIIPQTVLVKGPDLGGIWNWCQSVVRLLPALVAEWDGRLIRGMHFGHFANKEDGVPLIPPQIAYCRPLSHYSSCFQRFLQQFLVEWCSLSVDCRVMQQPLERCLLVWRACQRWNRYICSKSQLRQWFMYMSQRFQIAINAPWSSFKTSSKQYTSNLFWLLLKVDGEGYSSTVAASIYGLKSAV